MIVPLLIVWLGYGAREATGTSLMAIVVIAAVAVTLQAFYGNVDPPNAALVGIPAIGGAVAGTALQQRIPERMISLLFAGLLVVIAGKLILRELDCRGNPGFRRRDGRRAARRRRGVLFVPAW